MKPGRRTLWPKIIGLMGALSHIWRIFLSASSALGSLSFKPSRFSALRSL